MGERLSLAWSQHWLLAVPVFAGAAWLTTRRWRTGFLVPTMLSVGLGIVMGQVIEPLAEALYYHEAVRESFEPLRVRAFIAFLAAGIVTLVLTLLAVRIERATGHSRIGGQLQ